MNTCIEVLRRLDVRGVCKSIRTNWTRTERRERRHLARAKQRQLLRLLMTAQMR